MYFAVRNVRAETQLKLRRGHKVEFKRKPIKNQLRKHANGCVNFLTQIGWLKNEEIQYEETSYKTVQIDVRRFDRWILETFHEIMRRYKTRREMVIILGNEKFYELTHCMMESPAFFRLDNSQFYGMRLIVLPWIDGVVLVPKEFLPIDQVPVKVPMSVEELEKHRKQVDGDRAAALWRMETRP